jgi:hypothetical protein
MKSLSRFFGQTAFVLSLALVSATPGARAQVTAAPSLLNFQGRLAKPDGTPVANGTYSVRFSLWDAASGGTEKWNQTVGSIAVRNGTFAVLLSGFAAATFNTNLWLELKIGSNAPLTPRQQLVSVAYAMKANTVPDGSIGIVQLANNAVNASKLVSDAASLSKVSGGTMTASGSKIGIGNASPDFPLHFATTLGDKISLFGTSGNHYGFGIQSFLMQIHADTAAADIAFGYGSSASFTERMRIKGNGNVGIGNSAPASPLSFGNNMGDKINLFYALDGKNYGFGVQPNLLQIHTMDAADDIAFGSGNSANFTESARIKGTGEFIAKVVTITGGSDVAEPYHVAAAGEVKAVPGMVVCIDGEKVGQMKVAGRAYDRTVAGIISGANGIHPGITLRQKGTIADGELPVASIGRVWCWCDADANGAIEAGDMLTTSDTPGHAMKVSDHNKANGAVIGKAMSSLKSGKGLVLVLVSLK